MTPQIHEIHEVMPGAVQCVEVYAEVRDDDNVVIITDKLLIARALAKAIRNREASKNSKVDCFYVGERDDELRPLRGSDKELPPGLKHALQNASIVFNAFDAGDHDSRLLHRILFDGPKENPNQRVFNMPGDIEHMFTEDGSLSLEDTELRDMTTNTKNLAVALTLAEEAVIQAGNTKLELTLGDTENVAIVSDGLIKNGTWGNLPGGEAFVLPEWAEGQIKIDRAVTGFPPGIDPFILEVSEEGRVLVDERRPSRTGRELERWLRKLENESKRLGVHEFPVENVRQICEFGIGTNPKAAAATILEIEKLAGTVHIAVGRNDVFGGKIKSPRHIDMVINEPTVTLDKTKVVIKDGELISNNIGAFPQIDYRSPKINIGGLSKNMTVKRFKDNVITQEEAYLCRKWTDFRSNVLTTDIGSLTTAREALLLWKSFGEREAVRISQLVASYESRIQSARDETDTVLRILQVMSKFGVVELTS